jgi:carbonic anhydrase
MNRTCSTLVVTCKDFRFQKLFDNWIAENLGEGDHDRVALAGGVQSWEVIAEQVRLATVLHQIKKLVLVNHEDCEAYGVESTRTRHLHDLKAAREKVAALHPELEVQLYYASFILGEAGLTPGKMERIE